ISEIITRRANAVAFFTEEALARIRRSCAERLVAGAVLAVGGDPLRPAGVRLPGEDRARKSIFSRPEDRGALRPPHEALTRHLPNLPFLASRRHLPSERREYCPSICRHSLRRPNPWGGTISISTCLIPNR